jgi:hypothetical protein
MKPQLYCDIDSTINNHWVRVQRNSKEGVILPEAFSREEVMKDEPLPGAKETLAEFIRHGWDVHFLTSRSWDTALYSTGDISAEWLRKHGFSYSTLNIVNSHHEKIPFLKSHHCDLYIDDFTGGQEFGGPPFAFLHCDIMNAMPCMYERFRPHDGGWGYIAAKYFERIPNGELFWQLALRNMNWWRGNRDFEATSRARYYENFMKVVGLTPEYLTEKNVAEIGAGPFGGLIRHMNPATRTETYIDILANAQRVLQFIKWPPNSRFVDCPMECIDLPDKSVDVLLSYNALDHGSDIFKALDEIVRVSKAFFIAFDCKGSGAPPHDRLDHYQTVYYPDVLAHVNALAMSGKIKGLGCMGTLTKATPDFHFEHNWGFPVFYCHGVTL